MNVSVTPAVASVLARERSFSESSPVHAARANRKARRSGAAFMTAPGRVVKLGQSNSMTMRVPDCQAAYTVLRERGAEFITPPQEREGEVRCFFRDPDGHLLEISERR